MVGFRTALTKVINDYARKNNLLKEKEENLTGEDVRDTHSSYLSKTTRASIRRSNQE